MNDIRNLGHFLARMSFNILGSQHSSHIPPSCMSPFPLFNQINYDCFTLCIWVADSSLLAAAGRRYVVSFWPSFTLVDILFTKLHLTPQCGFGLKKQKLTFVFIYIYIHIHNIYIYIFSDLYISTSATSSLWELQKVPLIRDVLTRYHIFMLHLHSILDTLATHRGVPNDPPSSYTRLLENTRKTQFLLAKFCNRTRCWILLDSPQFYLHIPSTMQDFATCSQQQDWSCCKPWRLCPASQSSPWFSISDNLKALKRFIFLVAEWLQRSALVFKETWRSNPGPPIHKSQIIMH